MSERPGLEILTLLMPMFSGHKDEFGREEVPPLPLSFDRVNNGDPPRSNAPLFRLPFEILSAILQHVASHSLASLALVNRDCLQLARSRQFASVHLDYSISSSELLKKLAIEGSRQCSSPDSKTSLPRLGPCIRRITVATHPGWVAHRHGVGLGDDDFNDLPKDEQTERMVNASNAFFGHYVPSIQAILNSVSLPHLELLDWEDKICLSPSFFETLALSPIKHLKLFRVAVDSTFSIVLRESPATYSWPLRTLYLELYPHIDVIGEISTSLLVGSILRLCSPTLEELILKTMFQCQDAYTFHNAPTDTVPRFSKLRRLSIGFVEFKDSSMLEAFLQDSLQHLEVGWTWTPVYVDFFDRRGTIPSLQTFVWNGLKAAAPPYKFLKENPQIAALALPASNPGTLLEQKIVPLLVSRFRNLTSLHLVWEDAPIPDSALQEIGSLKTLRQIHLSAGEQCGWKHTWLINHNALRRHLRTLPLLKKIAFSRDTYNYSGISWLSTESYYTGVEHLGKGGESRHRRRILKLANKYVSAMSKLEWIFFGKIPMAVEIKKLHGKRRAVALSEERDSCYTLLRSIFGGGTD